MLTLKAGRFLLLSTVLTLAGASIAVAAGGGGAGMSGSGNSSPMQTDRMGPSTTPHFDDQNYDPTVEYRKGLADMQAGRFKEAEVDFDHVLEVDTRSPDALYMLGMARVGHGDFKGAARAYEKALKVDPKRIDPARELAITDAKLGQADKASVQLGGLKARAATCADACPEASDLKAAISAVEAALTPKAAA
jgi:TolA-binding protein